MAGSRRERTSSTSTADAATAATKSSRIGPGVCRGIDRHICPAIGDATTMTAPITVISNDTRPTPIAVTTTPVRASAVCQSTKPSSLLAARYTATGAATSALRWSGTASTIRYAVNTRQRALAIRPAWFATASVTATSASDAAYTSASVALSRTELMPPAQRTPPSTYQPSLRPRSNRGPRAMSATLSTPVVAVQSAENRLHATAYGRNGKSRAQSARSRMKSGVPGGWGMPNDLALAMNSPASQKVTSGASVAT